MKRICACKSNQCRGKVDRYKVYSSSENATYPNRFWGVMDYCKKHAQDDIDRGFVLVKANKEERTVIL